MAGDATPRHLCPLKQASERVIFGKPVTTKKAVTALAGPSHTMVSRREMQPEQVLLADPGECANALGSGDAHMDSYIFPLLPTLLCASKTGHHNWLHITYGQ
jgi:hypothetical protein